MQRAIKQSAPKAFAVVDVEWIHSNEKEIPSLIASLIHIDKSKYTMYWSQVKISKMEIMS